MSSCSRLRLLAIQRATLLIVLAVLSACAIPTDLPIFDVQWVAPVEQTQMAVSELLPAAGTVTIAGSNFDVAVPDIVLVQTLGGLCAACIPADGLTVPKPAFSLTYNQAGSLPADVVSVELVSGSVTLTIQNNLGFDPIRPEPASPGTMTVTLYDVDASGRQLGQVMLDGTTDALPAGLTNIPVALAPGTVSSTIFAEVDVVSPLGDPVLIDITNDFTITAIVGTASVSSATLDVDGLAVGLDPTNLDVGGIDTGITDRILSGSLILDIQNPFGVGVTMTLDISGPGFTTLSKNVVMGSAATSQVTVAYTADELRSFLGQSTVSVSGVGTVVSPGVPATVTPTQQLVVDASLDIQLEIS